MVDSLCKKPDNTGTYWHILTFDRNSNDKKAVIPELLKKIAQTRVLVVGDAMLDRYWYGGVERISPEAPVPVVAVNNSEERPGGAANVASNVTALGAHCTMLAVTGDDADADSLDAILKAKGIEPRLLRDKLVKTTVKLRVVSQQQQLIRIDFEAPASKDARKKLLDDYLSHLNEFDVVILSDYGKGGLGDIREMIVAAHKNSVPLVIDPKGDDYTLYQGATMITPNRKEFEMVAGHFRDEDELVEKAKDMVEQLELESILVTRSEEGMSLINRSGNVVHMPARAREVFDVTGAGDTVIATIATAYAADAEPADALHLANIAAGIVVGKLGSATATPEEIGLEYEREEN
ncbi:MAG: D-glycero-beta-D-manno-heptose-7-phosphate kinase [Acidiferrobacterales bacterium]